MELQNVEYAGAFSGSVPGPPLLARESTPTGSGRYESHPGWSDHARHWEAGETHRLNEAHWQRATDSDINDWLRGQLGTLRTRALYETRQNPTLAGIAQTLAEDVVGPAGPQLNVQSDDQEYDQAAEEVWRRWWRAPTFRGDLSGPSLLKLWIRNLPRCGEFLALIETDRDADGPVQMRLRPLPPRRLDTPPHASGDPRHVLGVELDSKDRPVRYWIKERDGYGYRHDPWPADLVIHNFMFDEEGQARGFPWFTPSLESVADLRDYDVSVQQAARRGADHNGMFYTDREDATLWTVPESTTLEPGTINMAPPGWKPFAFPAVQPAAQYPDYRGERQRDAGRPFNMPLLMIRLDASKHNYSSARLDTQSWDRTVAGVQLWVSGSPVQAGTLNQLVDLVLQEAKFSDEFRILRRKPRKVEKLWIWTPRGHVDPNKEAKAETEGLTNRTESFGDALAARGRNLDQHIRRLAREEAALRAAGITPPAWMTGGVRAAEAPATPSDVDEAVEDAAEEAPA
ncbi:MAG: phage portal protein [Pseudomonadota bacterium]|nr:phage portal protein [Pseudomonadota bacterium]